jgi:Ribbon-helix-helix protein, copG family
MDLIRKQIYITPAQDRAVKRLAQQQGITEAEILREALDQFLVKAGIVENEDPFAELIGMFEGPVEVDHDDIYLS